MNQLNPLTLTLVNSQVPSNKLKRNFIKMKKVQHNIGHAPVNSQGLDNNCKLKQVLKPKV